MYSGMFRKEHIKLLLLFFYLIVFSGGYFVLLKETIDKFLMFILLVFLSIYSYSWNIGSLNKLRNIIVVLITTVLGLYPFIDRIAQLSFGFPLNVILGDALAVVLATNTSEIMSFIKNFKSFGFFKALCLLFAIISYNIALFIKSNKSFNRCWGKYSFSGICVIFTILMMMSSFPIRQFITSIPKHFENIYDMEKYAQEKNAFVWNAKSGVKGKSTIVIILGETTRGDHMSLNGYERKTTPRLDNEDVISFKNAISNGMHTLAATPFILTRKPLETDYIYRVFPEKSIISAYKEAGYKTYYISYLRNVHVGDNAINQIVNEADQYIQRPWGKEQKSDSMGIPIIRDILNNDATEKKLIIYKLIGSHFHFQERYPKQFDIYQPSFNTVEFKGPNIEQKDIFVNSYDNSILHTDYVVSSIINDLKKCDGDVALSFISDHGTAIYEDNKTLYNGYSRANFNIAYFFWLNKDAQDRLGIKNIQMLKDNVNKPVDQTYFIDTMFEVSGIKTDKKVGKSLFSHIDDADTRKIIVGDDFKLYSSLEK